MSEFEPLLHINQDAPSRKPYKRKKSGRKIRAQIRHMLAIASGIFPLAAAFTFIRSRFMLETEQPPFERLTLYFLIAGMVSFLLFAIARADKEKRRARQEAIREKKRRAREKEYQKKLQNAANKGLLQ